MNELARLRVLSSLSIIFYSISLSASVAGQKIISIFSLHISVGTIIFPLTYILIAYITEIFSFKVARHIIMTGVICNILIYIYLKFSIDLSPAMFWKNQQAYEQITSTSAYILLNSTTSYLLSELSNAYLMSKMKLYFDRWGVMIRATISTSIASLVDTTCMLPVINKYSPNHVVSVYLSLIAIKITYCLLALIILNPFFNYLGKRGIRPYIINTPLLFSSVDYSSNK